MTIIDKIKPLCILTRGILLAPIAAMGDLVEMPPHGVWERGPTSYGALLSVTLLVISVFGLVLAIRLNQRVRRMAEDLNHSCEKKEVCDGRSTIS